MPNTKHSSLETFVPLYITNRCDAECAMCGMRNGNRSLRRIAVNIPNALEQLDIIRNVEGISAVCFLSGEYSPGRERQSTLRAVVDLICAAFNKNYQKVYINIGSLYDHEIKLFESAFSGESRLVLSLFQETYDRETYFQFFGRRNDSNPKGDFDLRLSTPDRWLDAGFCAVDIGILVGISPIHFEIRELMEHALKLHSRSADVAISLPRVCGIKIVPVPIADSEYASIIRYISHAYPWAKVILTTRESLVFIRKMLEHIRIVSPGTSEVMPYTLKGPISNRSTTSQFVVSTRRPRPSWVLDALGLPINSIRYYTKKTNIPKENASEYSHK